MKRERGAILIVALVLLVLLGMMGTTSLRSVLFQEKVTTSLHDKSLAFESAEAGLTWCEVFYDQLTYAYFSGADTLDDGRRIGDEVSDSNDTASDVVAARDAGGAWYNSETLWQAAQESAIDFHAGDALSALASNPLCARERVVDEAPADSTQKYFSQTYSGKDDVMAGGTGSADRSGGIYHFRTIAKGVGRGAAENDDRALTKVVLQSDYFIRLE